MPDLYTFASDMTTTIVGGLAVVVLYAMFRRFKRFVDSVDRVHHQLDLLILVLCETIPGFETVWKKHNKSR